VYLIAEDRANRISLPDTSHVHEGYKIASRFAHLVSLYKKIVLSLAVRYGRVWHGTCSADGLC
jgi:hypothetical protein